MNYLSHEMLRHVFEYESGLSVKNIKTKSGPPPELEFSGFNQDGSKFTIASGPIIGTTLAHQAKILGRLQKNKVIERVAETIKMANITGDLAALKDRAEKSRAKAASARARVYGAFERVDAATDHADEFARSLEKEAAEVEASLGQFTNGPES